MAQNWGAMYTNDGKWDDTNSNMYYAFIVEFNYLRDDEISGYTKLTDYNGHSYYYDYVGYGGSSATFADPDRKISFGYLTNKLGGEYLINDRAQSLINAVYSAILSI